MNITAHLSSLYDKKNTMEAEIKAEMLRPLPNFLKLTELKRKKMAVKTEIVAMEMQNKEFATSS